MDTFQTVGERLTSFNRQFYFQDPYNNSARALSRSIATTLTQQLIHIANSGKTLPQKVSNFVNAPLHHQLTSQPAKALAAELTEQVQFIQRDLLFTVDDSSGKTVIVVKDGQTDQIVREIPSEKLRQLAQNLRNIQEQLEKSKDHLVDVNDHSFKGLLPDLLKGLLPDLKSHLLGLKGHLLDVHV
jgi:flagellar protein FlaG